MRGAPIWPLTGLLNSSAASAEQPSMLGGQPVSNKEVHAPDSGGPLRRVEADTYGRRTGGRLPFDDVDEILFATGDMQHYLVLTNDVIRQVPERARFLLKS